MSIKKLPPVQIEVTMRDPSTGQTWTLTGWAENGHTTIPPEYDYLPYEGPKRVTHEWLKYQFKVLGEHTIRISED